MSWCSSAPSFRSSWTWSKDHVSQVALLGATFMVTGAITDSIYALLAGRARLFFSASGTRLLSRISGGFMIGGGIWLALTLVASDVRAGYSSRSRAQASPRSRAKSAPAGPPIAVSPAWSAIRSWRISMPVFISPRASPCTGMV